LGLVGAEAEEWSQFIGLMVANFIFLMEEDPDTLCWSKNPKSGDFTTKMGYKVWAESHFEGDKKWWWSLIWKISAPLK
jgi:hypothetical protein